MLVWVFAFLFVLIFGALGYGSGAIRMLVALIGTFVSLALMGPLGRMLQPVADTVAANNLALQMGLPGFVAFVVVWLGLYALGFVAHKPVEHHYKYNEDDATRERFGKMNQAGGCVVGILIGMIVFFTVGKRVYAGGYLTAQTIGEGVNEPALVKLGTALRRSAATTDWEKTFSALDESPEQYYAVSDVLGVLYENPAVLEYLRDYPPFYALEDKPEFVDMAQDPEFMDLLKSKAGFSQVVNHPKARAVLANGELTTALLATDLEDFTAWVKTGVSPKYADEKILGRWKIDVASVLLSMRRQRGNIPPTEFAMMRTVLTSLLSPVRFKFFPDGRYSITQVAAPPVVGADGLEVAPAPAPVGGMDPGLAARYGLRPGTPPSAAAGAVGGAVAGAGGVAPAAPAMPNLDFGSEGTWERKPDGKYLVGLQGAGKVSTREVTFNELGRLVIPLPEAKASLVLLPSN